MALTTQLVNVGILPNDGTGHDLRTAFVKTNENVTSITDFLVLGPTFVSANVSGTLRADVVFANTEVLSETLSILGNTVSISPGTGTLVVAGGTGIGGNLHVGGTINGSVISQSVVAGTLVVPGSAAIAGNLQVNAVQAGSMLVENDVIINGALTVFGDVNTVVTSQYIIQHPTIEIGHANTIGNVSVTLSYNDHIDRGVDFFWYDDFEGKQQEGFFGFQNSTGKFTFIPKATYPVEGTVPPDPDIFEGALGVAAFDTVEANVSSTGTSNLNNLIANTLTVNDGITGTLLTATQSNVTTLGNLTGLEVSGNVTVTDGIVNLNGTHAWMYINGVAVATSDQAFTGGTVMLDTTFTSTTPSISPSTGAVVVNGGAGIAGDLYLGGNLVAPTLAANTIAGTLTTANQPNITTVGALGNLTVNGTVTATNLSGSYITAASVNASTISAATGLAGVLTTTGQPNITSVGTLTSLNVTGNVTASNFIGALSGNVSGTSFAVTSPDQSIITNVGTLGNLAVSGNTTTSMLIADSIQTTGNIQTASNLIAANIYGSVRTVAQPNITSVGTLTSLAVSGTSLLTGTATFAGSIAATGSGTQPVGSPTNRFGSIYATTLDITGTTTSGNFVGPIDGVVGGNTPAAGTFTSVSASGEITSVVGGFRFPDGTLQISAAITGDITPQALIANAILNQANSATITAVSEPTANTIVLRDANGSFSANVITANAFIGSGALLTSIPTTAIVDGNVTVVAGFGLSGGGVVTLGNSVTLTNSGVVSLGSDSSYITVSATSGNVVISNNGTSSNIADSLVARDAAGNFSANTITATTFSGSHVGSGTLLTNIPNSSLTNSSVIVLAGVGISGGGPVALGDSITINNAGVYQIEGGGHITVSSSSGAVTLGSDATSANVISTIVSRDANGNFAAGTMNATATSALYADLAERYQSDGQYGPGTVVVFGGNREVTLTGQQADVSVAGVVSTAPAYLMNADEPNSVEVALRGKVPVKVMGPVRKGDLLVTSYVSGYAVSVGKDSKYGIAIFAKSLSEDLADGPKVINAVVL